jgi:hypothetical protein
MNLCTSKFPSGTQDSFSLSHHLHYDTSFAFASLLFLSVLDQWRWHYDIRPSHCSCVSNNYLIIVIRRSNRAAFGECILYFAIVCKWYSPHNAEEKYPINSRFVDTLFCIQTDLLFFIPIVITIDSLDSSCRGIQMSSRLDLRLLVFKPRFSKVGGSSPWKKSTFLDMNFLVNGMDSPTLNLT